jgi:hypothetical protein
MQGGLAIEAKILKLDLFALAFWGPGFPSSWLLGCHNPNAGGSLTQLKYP